MSETEKRYNYLSYGKLEDGKVLGDATGYVTVDPERIREAKNGDVVSFGLPLENVAGTIAAMFPGDFDKASLPETNWLNVAMFNNDNFKLADRFKKAIQGKERIKIRVTGLVSVNEYDGKKSLQMWADNFHILWEKSYKGTNVGGGEDGYSYAVGRPMEKGKGQLAIQGFVARPEIREMKDGKKVLGFGVALNKVSKTLNYVLGSNLPMDEVTWVDVAIFDSDNFARAERAAKVIRQGAAIAGIGYATIEEHEGKERVSLSLNDFEVIKFAPRDEDASEEQDTKVTAGVTAVNTPDESPFEDDFDMDFDDDDLPF